MKKHNVISIRFLRPRFQNSAEVASTKPERNAPRTDKFMLSTRKNKMRTQPIADSAGINLVMYVLSPKILKAAASAQKNNGGFSRNGIPFNLGTTRSPVLAISAAIPATRGSSASHKCLLPRPPKKRRLEKTNKTRKAGNFFSVKLLSMKKLFLNFPASIWIRFTSMLSLFITPNCCLIIKECFTSQIVNQG